MSIAEGLLAGLQQPLSLEGAQLPADMSLYAGGGLDVLKAHEQKYKQQEYLDKQIKRNSKRLARELAKAYEISGYPEEQEKMSSVTNTPFIGSNVHSRRQYLLSKLAEQPNQSIATPATETETLMSEEPAPVEGAAPQYRVTEGVGPVNRLQMPPTPQDTSVPTPSPGMYETLRNQTPSNTVPVPVPRPVPAPSPGMYETLRNQTPSNTVPTPPPEAPGIMSRIGRGLGSGMNYLEGLGTQAVRQGTYGAQQLANLALRNSDYLSGLVDDDQEARILGNLMQGSGTAGDEAFYGQQLQALRDRVNSPGRTPMQQGVLDTLASGIGQAGNHMPAQARDMRNMYLEEQGRMMGIIPEGKAATLEQMAQLEKELGPTYDYFQGTSPEAQQAGVSAFGQPGGFTPISQYLGDAADRVVARSPKALDNAFEQAREYIGLPALNNAFRRARGALGFEDQVMGGNPSGALAQQQAETAVDMPEYDIGDIESISDQDLDQQFMNLASSGTSTMQVADNLITRNIASSSIDSIRKAIQLYDSGKEGAALDAIENLSAGDAIRAIKIMMAQDRTN